MEVLNNPADKVAKMEKVIEKLGTNPAIKNQPFTQQDHLQAIADWNILYNYAKELLVMVGFGEATGVPSEYMKDGQVQPDPEIVRLMSVIMED